MLFLRVGWGGGGVGWGGGGGGGASPENDVSHVQNRYVRLR